MYKYSKGNLVIYSDFEIRELRKEKDDIDLLIPIDLRVLNLHIDNMPGYIDDRFQFREVRNIIIRFTAMEDSNYCTIHILNNIDLQSSMVNFTMKYDDHSIRIVRSDYSVEMYLEAEKYKIRKSTLDDIDRMLEIYEDAREFMKVSGNPNQWVDGYPKKELLLQDIENGNSYVCLEGNSIVGTFYYEEGEEPTYKDIYEGQWLNDKPYGVVHRIASARGTKGVGEFCLKWCFDQSQNVRIDTHRDNIPMQRLLEKLGYKICGIIYVEDGSERIAYQKTSED